MKKSLVALATLAAATGAMAQVTISGYFGGSYDSYSVTNVNAARTGNTSENRVSDQASRILFNVNEDLGGGMTAVGQVDFRFNLDQTQRLSTEVSPSATGVSASAGVAKYAGSAVVNPLSGGNNHVGLRFKDAGTLRLGRQDVYYVDTASLLPGGMFTGANPQPVFHALATANASRTPNLIWFTSNRVNGLEATVAYSTNPLRTSGTMEVENDMGPTAAKRKGSGTFLRLNYVNGPLDATVAVLDFKSDFSGGANYIAAGTTALPTAYQANGTGADAAGNADQKGTTIVLKYQVSPELRVAYARSDEKQIRTASPSATFGNGDALGNPYVPAGGAGTEQKAKADGLGLHYKMGANNFYYNYAKRGNFSYNGAEAAQTGAKINTIAYSYDLSKNTSVGVMVTSLASQANAATLPFYQSNNAFGGNTPAFAGETHKITSFALRQNF
mgnify:CR=1 FL=1